DGVRAVGHRVVNGIGGAADVILVLIRHPGRAAQGHDPGGDNAGHSEVVAADPRHDAGDVRSVVDRAAAPPVSSGVPIGVSPKALVVYDAAGQIRVRQVNAGI